MQLSNELEKMRKELDSFENARIAKIEQELMCLKSELSKIRDKDIAENSMLLCNLESDLSNIEKREFSFLKVLGIENIESVHSNFLAWLFDPSENHGLGCRFANGFISKVGQKKSKKPQSVLGSASLSTVRVEREESKDRNRPDIRLVEGNSFQCIIENKILSEEGIDQTKRYYESFHGLCSKELFVYLTLKKEEVPKDKKHFVSMNYDDILPLLKDLILMSFGDTKVLIENYVITLERLIMASQFNGYSEKTQLYYKYAKAIREVMSAWQQDRELVLKTLSEKIKDRNWRKSNPDAWETLKTGEDVSIWKKNWYPTEKKGVCFELYPSKDKPAIWLQVVGESSEFLKKFAKILESHLNKKYPKDVPGNFTKNMTGATTFLSKELIFSGSGSEQIEKTLEGLDMLVVEFEDVLEASIQDYLKKY